MDFLANLKNSDELMGVLNAAIDKLLKKETQRKYSKLATELDYIANIYTQYCSNHLTKQELLDYFPVDDSLKDCVFKAIEVRKPKVCRHLVNLHNSSNLPLMKSFDWDLKFIVGNSSLAAFREQKATLILNSKKGNDDASLSVELNVEQIEKLIQELEAHEDS